MSKSFISEIGDQLGGADVDNTVGEHVKAISTGYYKMTDHGTVTNGPMQDTVDSKVALGDMGDLALPSTYMAAEQRLVLPDLCFADIYPVVGKYGLAVFTETTATAATAFSGDAEWLLDWRPYLIDMTPKEGEIAKTPVAELQKGNWLRKTDGSFAPVCGIKAAQKAALDGKAATLLFGNAGSHSSSTVASVVANVYDGTAFNPEALWGYLNTADGLAAVNQAAGTSYTCAVEVELYDGSTVYSYGNYQDNHIPAPWETTETKYSVFIGRETDVYLVDGSEKYGVYMRGLTEKPVPVGSTGFDPEFFCLRRTGISPGPSTVVGGKIRNFFYNYVNDNTDGASVKGHPGLLSILYNNGTYPATGRASQYATAKWARGCNHTGANGVAYPVAEGGYHSLNTFLCSLEAAYGNRNIFAANTKFSSGMSANDACNSASTYRTNGGFILNGDGGTKYYFKLSANMKNTYGITSDAYVYSVINNQYAHFQCMEPQVAASLAAEMGIAENADFKWNGGTWHYEVPAIDGIRTLADGRMNCRIYKDIAYSGKTIAKIPNCSGSVNMRCALAEGVNPTGDIWAYTGGGCEMVYQNNVGEELSKYDFKYSFYIEPDQTRWIAGDYVTTPGTNYINEYHADGSLFDAETRYTAIVRDSSVGISSDRNNMLSRIGYSPMRKIPHNTSYQGECGFNSAAIAEQGDHPVSGLRTRRRMMVRAHANATCSPRGLNSGYRPNSTSQLFGCAAQVLLA